MPWYYCYASHGPGHQSSSERIEYSDQKLSREEKEYLFNDLFGECDYPIGDIRLVNSLTRAEWDHMKNTYETRIRFGQKMLKVLEKTPVQGGLRPRQQEKLNRRKKVQELLEKAKKKNILEMGKQK